MLERQSREAQTVRWRQGEGSQYLAISSARTFGVVDGTSKRTRSVHRVFVTRNASLWWREVCEANRRPATWEDFCRALREQFQPEDYGHRGRDDLAMMRQYVRATVADLVFRFRAMCLKVPDLSEVEKLDRFVCALVQDIRLQVELRGVADFYEAVMFAERADAVITCIASHNACKVAPQKQKWGNFHRSPAPMRSNGDAGTSGSGGPEPMELGTANCQTLTRSEYEKLRTEKACFICRKPGHMARNCRMKKKTEGWETG